jgi:hypothetical protein
MKTSGVSQARVKQEVPRALGPSGDISGNPDVMIKIENTVFTLIL